VLRLLARFHQATVETATTRVAFDVATRMNIKGGTDKPTPNQTLPFRERLGCSPSEACVALGVGRTFFYKLVAERRIKVTKVGRRTIVSVPSLLRLLDGHR
jgi:excisionase family DNA binding protein